MRLPIKIPPQITRICLLTAGIIGLYFGARAILVPPSYGEFGHYRGDALREAAERQPAFAGKRSCRECHGEVAETLGSFEHQTLSCETCHGTSGDHVIDTDVDVTLMSPSRCVRCHREDPAKPHWFAQIDLDDHYDEDDCLECHMPHQPNEFP